MAELHTNLYFKHSNPETQEKLKSVFGTINDRPKPVYEDIETGLPEKATEISPDKGKELANELLSTVTNSYGSPTDDLFAESRWDKAGYHALHFVHGSSGTDIIELIVDFIGELAPGVDVRACLCGDDDPWEIFYRYENGSVKQEYFEPDEIEDPDELPEVYLWWHDGLPSEIKDGFLNEWLEEE